MRRTVAVIFSLLLTAAAVAPAGQSGVSATTSPTTSPKAPTSPAAAVPATPRRLVAEYCAGCHNARVRSAGLSFDGLDPAAPAAHADIWEKAARKLRLGMMPPAGARRPAAGTLDAMATSLEDALDRAAAARPNPGRPALHRLNRAEYANAVRDLLGLEVDVTGLLPPDTAAFGFDNVADAQASSPALLQAYLSAARKISALAVGDPRTSVGSQTYAVRQDHSQGRQLDGLPLGTVGGVRALHAFPLDGEYDFQVRLWRTNLSAIRGLEYPHDVELSVDGARILLATIGGTDDLVALQKNPTATSDGIEAQRLRVRVHVKAGQRSLVAAFLDETPAVLQAARLQPFVRDFDNPFGAERAPHVQSITVTGPFNSTGAAEPPSRRLFACRPSAAEPEERCVRRIAGMLARRAFRRPVAAGEVEGLLDTFRRDRATGTFDSGVAAVLRRVLASPSFVFRPEAEPSALPAGSAYAVNGYELASRLSFFLWSSIPDDELLRAAGQGDLSRPALVARQVRRMLADPKAAALTSNFAGQWLYLRNLRGIQPSSDLFPDFDDNLREAMRTEAELFFSSIVRDDRGLMDLLTADDTFVNERLARHYGIPGVTGSRFRQVRVADAARRGLLGKGAVLLATSHATTTSPVLRGKWILDNILGAPPPAPPPDVPALAENDPAAPRTMREQLERHRASPTCAGCHKLMDPIGFALENFDAVGAWRETSEAGAPLDTSDVLADGTPVAGVSGLRAALAARPEVFVRTFVEKLITYALGRGLGPEDMPAVRAIVRDARAGGYRFSAIATGIVQSPPFRMRTKAPADAKRETRARSLMRSAVRG
jgi:mono/diheme cytochrome c family protein